MAKMMGKSRHFDATCVRKFVSIATNLQGRLLFNLQFLLLWIFTIQGSFVSIGIAEIRTVRVTDFSYVDVETGTTTTTINEGDTVKWVTEHDYHDIISGTHPNPTGAFRSEILNSGNIFEVTFDRLMLKNFPVQNDTYDYYCEPHVFMGMTGAVKVIRAAKSFKATLTAFETVPPSNATSNGTCSLLLNPGETEISFDCSSTVDGFTGIELRSGVLGAVGPSVCFLDTLIGSCNVSVEDVDLLFDGGLYINFLSKEYPEGELRGQIVLAGGNHIVSGKIIGIDKKPIKETVVSDGVRESLTDTDGNYELSEVPNGVYVVKATKLNYLFKAEKGTNPFVVNNSEVRFRSFIGASIEDFKSIDRQVRNVLREIRRIGDDFNQKQTLLTTAKKSLRKLLQDPLIEAAFSDLNTSYIKRSIKALRRLERSRKDSPKERMTYRKLLQLIADARKITKAAY